MPMILLTEAEEKAISEAVADLPPDWRDEIAAVLRMRVGLAGLAQEAARLGYPLDDPQDFIEVGETAYIDGRDSWTYECCEVEDSTPGLTEAALACAGLRPEDLR